MKWSAWEQEPGRWAVGHNGPAILVREPCDNPDEVRLTAGIIARFLNSEFTTNFRQMVQNAEDLVRESGYHLCRLKGEGEIGESWSRSVGIYNDACRMLRLVNPDGAEDFIKRSWKCT